MSLKRRIAWTHLTIGCLVMGLICFAGCRKDDESTKSTKSKSDENVSDKSPKPITSSKARPEPTTAEGLTARGVLDAMVDAYQNATTYSDNAMLKISGRANGAQVEQLEPYLVALQRPNKLRLQVGPFDKPGLIVVDGTRLRGFSELRPIRFLQRDAPGEVTIESLYADHELGLTLMNGASHTFAWIPIQLILLMADDPLKTLLYQADRPTLLFPAKIEQDDCDRIRVDRLDGTAVFWIDRKTHVLRRFEFPINKFRSMIEGMTIEGLSLTAEFNSAEINEKIDRSFFEFKPSPECEPVDELVPAPIRLLGKRIPELKLVDLEGKAVNRESMTGKITLLCIWAKSRRCVETMPAIQRLYTDYQDQVSFYGLNVDNESVLNDELTDVLEDVGVKIPILREAEPETTAALECQGIPTIILLDDKGIVQDYSIGVAQDTVVQLSLSLDVLLRGEDLFDKTLVRYQDQKERLVTLRRESIEKDLFIPPWPFGEYVQAEIASRTDPTNLKLTQLWHSEKLISPSNILTIERSKGPPRLLVLDDGRAVVDFDIQGNVKASIPLDLQSVEPIRFLRTATDSKGKRYFAGASNLGKQVYMFDERFKQLWTYPKDQHDNPYGIGDVLLSDLDANGQPEVYVGFLNVTGVHGVSLDGKGLWRNRTVANAVRLSVLDPNAKGHRMLVSLNNDGNSGGNLKAIDHQGKSVTQLALPNRSIGWIAIADLDGDGHSEMISLCSDGTEKLFAVGFDQTGRELWSYPFPQGVYEYPLDSVIPGDLLGDGSGQWILGAPNGTIHILTATGKLLDTFAYGAPLSGLAATHWNGKQVLLVATPSGVDAWQVELPTK